MGEVEVEMAEGESPPLGQGTPERDQEGVRRRRMGEREEGRCQKRRRRSREKESNVRFALSSEGLGQLIEQQSHKSPINHGKGEKIQKEKGIFASLFHSSSLSSSASSSSFDDCPSPNNKAHTAPFFFNSSESCSSSRSTSSSSSEFPTAYEAAFSNLPRFSGESGGDGTSRNMFRQKDVMGLEILSTGEKTYFTKPLRDLCVLVNQIAINKEQAQFEERKRNRKKKTKNDTRATGWMVPRDLRRLDFSLFPNLEPQILPRRHCLIFAIEQLRGLLTEDRLILLLPEGADGFLQMLDQRLAHTLEYPKLSSTKNYSRILTQKGKEQPVFLSNDSSAPTSTTRGVFPDEYSHISVLSLERETRQSEGGEEEGEVEGEAEGEGEGETVFLPFELRVMDSLLETVVWLKQRELKFLSDHNEQFINRLKRKSSLLTSTKAQEELRTLRTEVLTMTTRLTNIRRVLEGLLDNEEDMALFNLSLLAAEPELYDPPLQPEILEAHAEVELLLEAYLQNFHEIITDLDVMLHELNATEALMSLRLDTARNQLLSYTTMFSLIGMGFAIGSYVGSLFGTNLESGLESGKSNFVIVSVVTSVVVVLIIAGFGFILYQKDMLVK